jgi:S1-C subfamily serine protease
VIDGANYATVERSDGGLLRVDGVAALDRATDLVLLKVTADAGERFPTLPLAYDEMPRSARRCTRSATRWGSRTC